MKTLLLALLFPFFVAEPVDNNDKNPAAANVAEVAEVAREPHPTFDLENCTCKGISLNGTVKIVENES